MEFLNQFIFALDGGYHNGYVGEACPRDMVLADLTTCSFIAHDNYEQLMTGGEWSEEDLSEGRLACRENLEGSSHSFFNSNLKFSRYSLIAEVL